MQKGLERTRSVSEPGPLLQCGSISRERRRETEVGYETGKDRAAFWISQWSREEMCAVLYHLICRCRRPQLDTLCTSLECVPHRDLQLSTVGVSSGLKLYPISTPLSRQVRVRLRKSRRPQNRRLYRSQSVVIHEDAPIRPPPTPSPSSHITQLHTRHPTLTPSLTSHHHLSPPHTHTHTPFLSPLALISSSSPHISTHLSPSPHVTSPSGRCSTAPPRPLSSPDSRTLTTPRRHMTTPTTHNFHNRISGSRKVSPDLYSLPCDASQFLVWFSDLTGWQQQEVLHMIVLNLDPCELYYLSAILISRQYRDFVSCLSEPLALHLLSYVPAKDIFRNCTTVSRTWHTRCTSEGLWKKLCLKASLGMPRARGLSWRRLFMDSLRVKHNWWRGHYTVHTLGGHTGRVLCVKIRGNILATGSSDHTIRIWSLESGQCLQVLNGHTRGVWCLSFYGKRLLISGSSDQCIKVWNIETGLCERTLRAHSGVVWCMQHKREVLLTGSHDKTAVLWKVRSLCPSHTLEGHRGVVLAAELNDSATTAYTGAGDGLVRVWEVESGQCVKVVGQKGSPPITSLSWSKGYLAWGGGCTASVWNTLNWKRLTDLRGHEDRVECVELKVHDVGSGRGLVVTASRDCTIKYWTSHSGRLIKTLTGHVATVNAVCSNSQAIVSGSDDLTLRLWNFHSQYLHLT